MSAVFPTMTNKAPASLVDEIRAAAPLIEAVRALGRAESLDEVIGIVKDAARRATRADGLSFVLREGDQCYYVDESAIEPLWKGRRFPMTSCVSGWSMHHRVPAVIPDVAVDDRIPKNVYRHTFVRSLVIVPIRSSAPIGAIGAYWSQPHEVPRETVHWLQALADATSAALEAVTAGREADAFPPARGERGGDSPREIVRMCAWTRRIQHEGRWLSLEAFLRARFGILVSHGISEDAVEALTDEMQDEFGSDRRFEPM